MYNDSLKKRRKELGLTMAQVAEYVGVSEATISRWESGNIANMRRDKIASLSKILQITPATIMGIDDESNPPEITDDDIKFALFGGDGEITDDMYEEVKSFAQYVKEKYKNKKE